MKMKGSWHQLAADRWSCYPQTREAAQEQKIAFFEPFPATDPCPREGHESGSIVYTKTGIRKCCAIRDSFTAYNEAVKNGEPTDPNAAHTKGYDFYWQPDPGPLCGHNGKMTLHGKCYDCEQIKTNSPRQQAIKNGERWYTPDEPCPKCGQRADRYVDNGRCQGCDTKRGTVEKPVYQQFPDMIIDRETARTNGFNAYRTGKPCRRGHNGWRYVSSGNCVECLRER